jgi:hypothetical protein
MKLHASRRHRVSERKFYRTQVTVDILSDEPVGEITDLDEIHHQITDGGWSGQISITKTEEVDGPTMATLLRGQGSDPDFFRLDADGNDAE